MGSTGLLRITLYVSVSTQRMVDFESVVLRGTVKRKNSDVIMSGFKFGIKFFSLWVFGVLS